MPLTAAQLTTRIEAEFATAWVEIKHTPPPPIGPELHVVFTAVARGVLGYLKANEGDVITSLAVTDQSQRKSLTAVDATLGIGT